MKIDLARLPLVHRWGEEAARKLSPRTALWAACGLVAVIALFPAGRDAADAPGRNAPLTGPASAVLAGDALVIGGTRIQLWGIAAARAGSEDGAQAQAYLTALVDTHSLTCRDTGQRHYDRTIARCFDPWERDVAELMVRAGWASDQAEFSRGHYAQAEAHAASLRVGVFRRHGEAFAAPSSPPPLVSDPSQGAYLVPRITAVP